jgi:hypothetical protein
VLLPYVNACEECVYIVFPFGTVVVLYMIISMEPPKFIKNIYCSNCLQEVVRFGRFIMYYCNRNVILCDPKPCP